MRSRKRRKSSPRVKIEKSDDLCKYPDNEPSKLPFAVGDEVLACWQDGLFYLAVVKTINTEKSKCQVTYEDDSVYWVLFKHIRTVAKSKDTFTCSICETNESTDQNCIVLCDNCFHGYHQTCHTPVIDKQSVESEWLCRFCVFSKAVKAGGALKCGVYADALLAMKSILPYNLNTLQWDAHHKCNTDEVYCYCAGPGLWYYKMLECQKCNQWFHEACLQCLDFPLLLGDRFYYFLCAVCNNGEEYLKRIQLKWTDIAALVLYNLSLKYHKRGFKNNDVECFLRDNWDALQCGNLYYTPERERMEKLVEVMKKQKRKFRCQSGGSGIVTWSLFIRCAPFPTKASLLHEAKLREDESGGTTSEVPDCNGNYLQDDDDIEDNSSTSNENNTMQNHHIPEVLLK
ncbi:metal-response element-binding transcription factor 2-like isoform X2 [Dendronephthya gigantea]|uniref:metal-response element-binding transcription factor 2-like isoform X2 n=1 Tax=Dendronephthya gigantea TaxID=151771 RepID=UPI00106CF5DB|nr:metal-response element-binding transcription factor 2-like isoform X2 [Dendronephthya gigantea]